MEETLTKVELVFDIGSKTWMVNAYYGNGSTYVAAVSKDMELIRRAHGDALREFYLTTKMSAT